MLSITKTILKNLITNEDYLRKVQPFVISDYFEDNSEKLVFNTISDYIAKYNALPTPESIEIDLNNNTKAYQKDIDKAKEIVSDISSDTSKTPEAWLLDKTEAFCKNRALEIAILDSYQIVTEEKEGKGTRDRGIIPSLLSKAISVCFDPNVGHDYLDQYDDRYDAYHEPKARLSWGIKDFDKITNGGIPSKTLTVLIGGVNVGKTLAMCSFATNFLKQGKNVLYITLEVQQYEIGRRIDANALDVDIDEILELPENSYKKKLQKLKSAITTGKLVIKEYPTASASATNFKHLLEELKLKKNFIPDVIFIDYINICASARVKVSNKGGLYEYIKLIAEELRGMAVEYNTRVFTATQLNRSGFGDSDPDLTHVAESFGLPATADFMAVIINNDKLESLNQYSIKQVKNRFGNATVHKRFNIGVDRSRQRLYELSGNSSTTSVSGSGVTIKKFGKKHEMSEEEEKIAISKEHGSEAYKPAYSSATRQFGSRKQKFEKFKYE